MRSGARPVVATNSPGRLSAISLACSCGQSAARAVVCRRELDTKMCRNNRASAPVLLAASSVSLTLFVASLRPRPVRPRPGRGASGPGRATGLPASSARASQDPAFVACACPQPSAPIPTSALCNAHRRQRACPPESRAPRHRKSESCGDSRCPDHVDQLASGRRSRLGPGTRFGRQSRQFHPTSVLTQAARLHAGLSAQTHRLASGSPAVPTDQRLSTTHQPAGNPTSGLL